MILSTVYSFDPTTMLQTRDICAVGGSFDNQVFVQVLMIRQQRV
jgi:hypothetical protein